MSNDILFDLLGEGAKEIYHLYKQKKQATAAEQKTHQQLEVKPKPGSSPRRQRNKPRQRKPKQTEQRAANKQNSAPTAVKTADDRVAELNAHLDQVFADIDTQTTPIQTHYRSKRTSANINTSHTGLRNKQQLRQAILAKEILSAPKALRKKRS